MWIRNEISYEKFYLREESMNQIAFVSQSGNVAKSTLACSIAVECEKNNLQVSVADLDIEHRTTYNWSLQRKETEIEPSIKVYTPESAQEALSSFDGESLQIIDAPSRATSATLLIAKSVNLLILPTPPSKKDIDLTLKTIIQLRKAGVDFATMLIVFTRVGTSSELARAKAYVNMAFEEQPIRILSTPLWEKVGYRSATNDGYALTETPFPTLNEGAKAVLYELLANLLGIQ